MSWNSLKGHDDVVRGLQRAASEGRFPHALLFVGPEGVGKRLAARTLARALLCERNPPEALDPCGTCPACILVEADTHPDLIEVGKPEDRTELPIATIRKLTGDLGLKPMRGGRRVAIVDDADDLSEEASNAFLKTLEEPPPGSVLVLIGTAPELQLDTIRSRCRILRFGPLAVGDLMGVLLERGLADDPDSARRLAVAGEGSVSRALALADPDLSRFRRAMLDALADPKGFDPPALARKIDAFVKEAGKESGPKRRRASLLFGELAGFFRAVLWGGAGLEPPSPDPADRRAAQSLAERLDPEAVFVLADRCLLADYQVRRMAYLPIVLDALAYDLGRSINPSPGR